MIFFTIQKLKMGSYVQIQHCLKYPISVGLSILNKDYNFQTNLWSYSRKTILIPKIRFSLKGNNKGIVFVCNGLIFPVDDYSWAQNVDSSAIASQLSAISLIPYMGFLYFITKSKSAPRLTLFGFYFLLVFVAAAIPAGIYAKVHYVKSLANVDWLHGGAESLLMLTNLFIVLGLRRALRKTEDESEKTLELTSEVKEKEKSTI
ncbi:hypothetical protein CASFOL_010917 [Castilleja foliolosa]|uniref:Uncharacterized protein n=1 Tax=Castilleja foliolosa TaxID=1961234 RepID=A0ABD3DW05_9LAMI